MDGQPESGLTRDGQVAHGIHEVSKQLWHTCTQALHDFLALQASACAPILKCLSQLVRFQRHALSAHGK